MGAECAHLHIHVLTNRYFNTDGSARTTFRDAGSTHELADLDGYAHFYTNGNTCTTHPNGHAYPYTDRNHYAYPGFVRRRRLILEKVY